MAYFVPYYQSVAAELSDEEQRSVQKIVQRNYAQGSGDLVRLAQQEHPLCLEGDIRDAVINHMALILRQLPSDPPYDAPAKKDSTGLAYPEDPHSGLSSRWMPDEIQHLQEYLSATKGRKNWIQCARYVGTKSSAQCKAKHNNMRVQESLESFEV
ncbi:hypothetical protein GGF46_001468 [Coemansia sp. RSA 552]|nr:hypothetical protein GGF46_001468 [Coemansia sp. RSA 552]